MFDIIVASLSGCINNGLDEGVENILNLAIARENNSVYEEFDVKSKSYFDKLVKYSKEGNSEKAEVLGEENGIPISTLTIFDNLTEPDTNISNLEVTSLDYAKLKVILFLNRKGVFRSDSIQPIKFREIKYFDDSSAKIIVTVPTGYGPLLSTTYLFSKEGNDWKLNFPSTLSLMEKIYSQGFKRSGLNRYEYAKFLNRNNTGPIDVRYDKNY